MFRLLMVDNDITHANLTARGIQDLRFGVTMKYALSAAQGLLYLAGTRKEERFLPGMIVLSVDLPDGQGLDVFRAFHEAVAHESIPIVVVSKSPLRKAAVEYHQSGASAYVPFSESVEGYMSQVGDSVAFVAMLAGLVPIQQQFLPADRRTEPTLGEVLQVHL